MESNKYTMDSLEISCKGKIIGILPESKVKRRLMDMGIVRGTEFIIEGKAPFGDPLQVNLRGYSLTLRKAEAKDIIVEKL